MFDFNDECGISDKVETFIEIMHQGRSANEKKCKHEDFHETASEYR
jgi:hypothetical protein